MSSEQGPRKAGMRAAANGASLRQFGGGIATKGAEEAT